MGRIGVVKWLSILFFLIPVLFILVFPFIVMISTSFKSLQEVSQIPPTFIPRQPTLANYREVWNIIPSGWARLMEPFGALRSEVREAK